MKILIVGCNGFIGTHALRYFKSLKDYEVWGCDVQDIPSEQKYISVDLSNPNFSDIFKKQKFELCLNASGSGNVPLSVQDPHLDFELNVNTVFKLVDSIRQHNADCKFIHFSSAAVYGNPSSLPVSEDQRPNPLSPYGFHKFQSELINKEFYEIYKTATCNVRIFSAYGPGQKKQLFWDWFQKSKASEVVRVLGTGNESRDFIYIEDLIRAFELIARKTEFKGETINIGNGEEIFIKDAAKAFFAELAPQKKYLFEGGLRSCDPINWKADVTKLKDMGYRQKTTFDQGILEYAKWLKTQN